MSVVAAGYFTLLVLAVGLMILADCFGWRKVAAIAAYTFFTLLALIVVAIVAGGLLALWWVALS